MEQRPRSAARRLTRGITGRRPPMPRTGVRHRCGVRGLPAPSWGTRTRPRTTSNCGESPRCPAATTIDMGFRPARRPGAAWWSDRPGGPGRSGGGEGGQAVGVGRVAGITQQHLQPQRGERHPKQRRQRGIPVRQRSRDQPGGASEPVVLRLGNDAAGRFLLQVPLSPRPCSVLVGPADGGVDVEVPGDQVLRLRAGLELGEDPLPGAIPLPTTEQVLHPAPRPVLPGHVPPRDAGTDPEPYAVDQLSPAPYHRATSLLAPRQQRLRHSPLLVRQISTRHEPRSFHIKIHF